MLASIGAYDFTGGSMVGDVALSDLRLHVDRGLEVVAPLDGLVPVLFDRRTHKIDITFTVRRCHASIKAAEQYIIDHENLIPQSGDVKLTSASGLVRYVLNAVLLSHQLTQQVGSTTFHAYHIVGGPFYGTPVEIAFILLETGDFILTETSDKILLET
jgi:hypothetical protein